ncbi:type II toxin-antitoxin system PemK/MazF family toxin [Candidatus Kaiserbacteria bacterium]|nr:MAG: type II toxin-antitoxin system PemK/MazF family toxin [Candidatus Kaiserbacteria bacterium]
MHSKKTIQPVKGEIHLIPFPFTDLSQNKLRPCIVIGHDQNDMTVVFVTTMKPKSELNIEIKPTPQNRLKAVSYIRYTKIATLDTKMSLGIVGVLENVLYKKLTTAINDFIV